jgi:hypothetical protein
MSGAAGHVQHLFENRDLTFAELKDVLRRAADGKLEQVTEKLDGMNLVFTWDAGEERLKVARSPSEIGKGGLDAAGLAKRFAGRGSVLQAFNSAFKVLSDALSALPDRTKLEVFGHDGRFWYSMEVIYAVDPNVINYDSNNIVFHGVPVFQVTDYGVDKLEDGPGIGLLTSYIDRMQKAIKVKGWQTRGPSVLQLQRLSDGSALKLALTRIDKAMIEAGVRDNNTLLDYMRGMAIKEVHQAGSARWATLIAERLIEAPGAPSITQLKRQVPPTFHASMMALVDNCKQLQKQFIRPIEAAIQALAIEVLRGLSSTLIADSDKEITRLRGQVSKAIAAIEASGNEAALDVLHKEMERLGDVSNITAPMEGIVFIYKGQAYKFTGAFAPANQILGLFKYGRKGIPKMSME